MAKTRRGIPQKYSQLTQHSSLSLTPDGRSKLDALAYSLALSRSELIERIGRGLIKIILPSQFESLSNFLEELKGLYRDELRGRGLWRRPAKETRAKTLKEKINQIDKLLNQLEPITPAPVSKQVGQALSA